MKNTKNDEKGLTLVEVLAVIVIGSLLIILISNTHLFGQKQYKIQSEKATGLYDVSYALKVITKEIRKAENPVLIDGDGVNVDSGIFKHDDINKSINKNDIPFINDIETFTVKPNSTNSGKWKITIKSISGKEVSTEVVLRRGGKYE